MLSILILTYNEEQNLPACLESVRWSDDIMVLDSFSTDRTLDIAKAARANVLQNRFVNFADQRNFGLEQGRLKNQWVLHLDADEVVTPELKQELLEITKNGERPAYRLASKMMFEGKWLRFASLYPAYQVRVGRRDRLRFKMVGHGQRETLPPQDIGTIRNPLMHFSFAKGYEDWLTRHNRYSSAEARTALSNSHDGSSGALRGVLCSSGTERRRALKRLTLHLPCRPLLRFCYMYFLHLGFLDGAAGFRYCRLLWIYEYLTVLKIRELRQRGAEAQ